MATLGVGCSLNTSFSPFHWDFSTISDSLGISWEGRIIGLTPLSRSGLTETANHLLTLAQPLRWGSLSPALCEAGSQDGMSSVYTANALDLPVALLGQSMATTVPRDSLCSHPDWVLMFTSSSTGQRLGKMLVWETPAHLGVCAGSYRKPQSPETGGRRGRGDTEHEEAIP